MRLAAALLLPILLFGAALEEKIKSFVEPDKIAKHEKLLTTLFANPAEYYDAANELNVLKLVETLRDNGLLSFTYARPQQIGASFEGNQPWQFVPVVVKSLDALGYDYYQSEKIEKKEGFLRWDISFYSTHAIDPILFNGELTRNGCKSADITKTGSSWNYKIVCKG